MTIDIGTTTFGAATAARDALGAAARTPGERGMAAVARAALFDEALLAAIKARVAEFKAVAK
jgi:hypothetical protein